MEFGSWNETSDLKELHQHDTFEISPEAMQKFENLMEGDSFLEEFSLKDAETRADCSDTEQKEEYETDDLGRVYKKNRELLPDTEYVLNQNRYITDERGNPVSCDAKPRYTEEGTRSQKEQLESGGEERRELDDGGHIVAKILGGSEGAENLVPMRRTINRGDYKKMENELSEASREKKEVSLHVDLFYPEDSKRPCRMEAVYQIDGEKTETVFDNEENSVELADHLKGKIMDEDYDRLKEELQDMYEDDCPASVTSVKTEYFENGTPSRITVGLLDESSGTKTYQVYQPKGDTL